MKKADVKHLIPWVLVAVWMVVIFLFSDQTADASSDTCGVIFGMCVFTVGTFLLSKNRK